MTDAAGYTGGTYSINFTAAEYLPSAKLPPAWSSTSGTYTTGSSDHLRRRAGRRLSGQPAAGDSFDVAPSGNQSLFTTVQNLVTALQAGADSASSKAQLNNSIAGAINNIDQALSQTPTVQANVGGRLNTITTQQSRRDQPANAAAAIDLVPAEPGLRQRHHQSRFAKHHAERRDAGLHPDAGVVAVQVHL